MNTLRMIAFTGLLFCVSPHVGNSFAALPSATSSPADDMNFTLEGKITDKSPGKLTVSSGENIIFHVVYNEKTAIKKKDGNPGTPDDLRTGVTIAVAGDLAESGEISAKTIDIEGEGEGKQ
jgi:hypothetical protein